MQNAGPADAERSSARSLDADQPHVLVRNEVVEHPDRVRATADARDHGVGQASLDCEQLLTRLAADHTLQLAHDLGVGGRADT